MKTIFKYEVAPRVAPNNPTVTLALPEGAKVLTAATQNDRIFLWAEVDTDKPVEKRFFQVFGTGHEMPTGMGIDRAYINTVFIDWMVFHVYESL